MIPWKHLLAAAVVPGLFLLGAAQAADAPAKGAGKAALKQKVLAKFDRNGDGKLGNLELNAKKVAESIPNGAGTVKRGLNSGTGRLFGGKKAFAGPRAFGGAKALNGGGATQKK